jgi:predicted PurR-regulated permease PerM
MSLVALLGYVLYGKAMGFAEELPVYASKVQQTIEPISKKIQNFQQSAGNLANDVHATKNVPEVRLQESPTWPDYLVRGVGSVWGALIIAGVVPFLTFFMLCTKDQMAIRMDGLFGSRIDAARFITNLNQMIRGFVAGNLIVGSVMAVATTLVLWSIGMKGAIPLGIASGLLNNSVPRKYESASPSLLSSSVKGTSVWCPSPRGGSGLRPNSQHFAICCRSLD